MHVHTHLRPARLPQPADRPSLAAGGCGLVLRVYWIVDVETPERAYAIAAEASAAPGPGGRPLNLAIEVRQVMTGPPTEWTPDA